MSHFEKNSKLLTGQERRVLDLVARAKTNKEIACDLKISPATVKRHLENILRKLKLKNRVEAAVYSVMTGNSLAKLAGHEFSHRTVHGPTDG